MPCQLKTPAQKEPLDLAEKQGVKRKAENFDANNSSKDVAGKAKEASTADGELFNHQNPSSFDAHTDRLTSPCTHSWLQVAIGDTGCKDVVAGTSAAIVTTKSSAQFDATVDYGETLSSDSDQESQGARTVGGRCQDSSDTHTTYSAGLQGVDVQTTDLVLAQFDKVTRAKNKWKCSLKGGVMTLNGKDVLFGKANGEFFWN